MVGQRADAAEAPHILVGDQPVGAGRAPLGQHADEVLEPAGDEVVNDAYKTTPARKASSWVTALALSKIVGAPS